VHPNKSSSTRTRHSLVLGSCLILVGACYKEEAPKPSATTPTVSTHNRVKFKGGKRFVADIASALSLETQQVCRELASYDCEQTHRIPLGGIDPYQGGLFQPLPERSVASLNAIDRIALSACEERAKRDFADAASAVIFRELASGSATNEAKQAVVTRLYQKILRREPSSTEITELSGFYIEVEALDGAKASRSFATYACYAVATLEESVFF
jgi:hypothetical protein